MRIITIREYQNLLIILYTIKNLKIEAEKGFRRTLFEPELVDPNVEVNSVKSLMALVHFQH
jgi:hypothetical protein